MLFSVFGSVFQKKGANGTGEDLSGADKDVFEREKAQLDPDKKLELADYGLINTGTLKDLEAQCAILFRP